MKKKIFLALFIGFFFLFLIMQKPVQAATITVCSAGYGTCDYTTIQNGINHASAGDVINVTGTFTEDILINVSVNLSSNETLESNITGSLRITSNNTNVSRFNVTGDTGLNCYGIPAVICVEYNVSVTLNYLNVSGSSAGAGQYDGIHIYYSNLTTLFRNRITNITTSAPTATRGIHIQGSKHQIILGNNVTIGTIGDDVVYYPIYLESGGVDNINITSNYFTTSNASVNLNGNLYFGLDVSNILFENNNVTKMREKPFFQFGTNTRTNNTTIIGNRFYDNGANQGTCLYLGGFNISFYNNILANNTCTGQYLDVTQPNTAPANLTILNNTFFNGSSTAIAFTGVTSVSGLNVTNISNNNITNFVTGINIVSGNLTLYQNNISSNRYGINISSTASSFIFDNYFNNTVNNAKASSTQRWNTTKTVSTNIMGGANIAGNFWHDYAGIDSDGDGIGNTLIPYTSGGQITIGGDSAPLTTSTTTAQIHSLLSESNHTLFFNNAKFILNVSNATFANFTIQAPNGSLAHRVGGAFVNDTNGTWTSCNGLSFCNATSPLVKFDANGTWYINVSVGNTSFSNNKTDSLQVDIWNNVTYSQNSWTIVTGNNTNQSFQLTFNWSTNETINSTCEHTWPNLTDASNFTYGCEPSNVSQNAWIKGNGTFNVWARAGGSSIFKTYLWNVSHNISDSGAYYAKNITISYTLASTSATLNWTNSNSFDLSTATVNSQKCQNQNLNVTGNVSITNINISRTAVGGFALAQGTVAPNATNFNLTNGTNIDTNICFTPANTNTISQNFWYAYGIDANGNSVNMSMQNITQMIPMSGTPASSGGGGGSASGGGGGAIGCPEGYYSSGNTCLIRQTKAGIKSENFSFYIRPNEFVQELTLNDLGPNTSISWTFAIYNNETQADKLLYPVWKFTCTPEQQSSCLANWCQISPLFGTNQGTKKIIIASSSFERFKLSCIVPSNVTINQPYYGTILIYPEDYSESKAKKLTIELTPGIATRLKSIVGDNPFIFWFAVLLIIIVMALLVAKLFRLF